jgi:uncharacterized membrane protein YuzA (DUF378 family)
MGIEEIVYIVSALLVIVGDLNWGAYALGHNLVEKLGNKNVQKAIYYLIAISGIVLLVFLVRSKGRKNYDSSTKTSKTRTLGGAGENLDIYCTTDTCLTSYFKSGNDCLLGDNYPLDHGCSQNSYKDKECKINGCFQVARDKSQD